MASLSLSGLPDRLPDTVCPAAMLQRVLKPPQQRWETDPAVYRPLARRPPLPTQPSSCIIKCSSNAITLCSWWIYKMAKRQRKSADSGEKDVLMNSWFHQEFREVPQWDGTCLCLKTIRRLSFRADSNWMNGWKPHQKKAGEPIRWKGTVLSCLVCILLVFCVFLYKLCETEHQNLNQETLILNASKRETVREQKNHLRPYIKETTLVLTRNAPQTSCPWGG